MTANLALELQHGHAEFWLKGGMGIMRDMEMGFGLRQLGEKEKQRNMRATEKDRRTEKGDFEL